MTRQGWIQDLEKEGAQGVRGLAPQYLLANLGDFLKNLAQKAVGKCPLRPPLDPRLPDALKGGGEELKCYRTVLEGDEEALINNGSMLVFNSEAMKGDA